MSGPVSGVDDLDVERSARAEAWRLDQAERAAICAGLTWPDCVRALVEA